MNTNDPIRRLAGLLLAAAVFCAIPVLTLESARAAVPGISGTTFNLTASATHITQPDGSNIYSWGYGCSAGSTPSFVPFPGNCPLAQIPGPTLVLKQGDTVTITLTNALPAGAGNTSIVFTGATVSAAGGAAGLLAQEATPGGSVTYTLTNLQPGTHAYYSGTEPSLQVEMGMYGAMVVLPSTVPANCSAIGADVGQKLGGASGDFRLSPAAYNHPEACYDREYLFQWAEIDPDIHTQAEQQANYIATCTPPTSSGTAAATNPTNQPCPTALIVATQPYLARYFLINGRSMPDDMDPDYAPNYPQQPYNGNPHMHPGDLVLVRSIGQGHLQHPFHEHANHVRILARDGNLILSQNDAVTPPRLSGRMEFTTDTTPGQAFDGIFYWSGKGLGWDIYAHTPPSVNSPIISAVEGANQQVTITAALPLSPAPVVGQLMTVTGLPGYNGTYPITGVGTGPNNGQAVLTYTSPAAGLAPFTWTVVPNAPPSSTSIAAVNVLLVSFDPKTGSFPDDPTPCIPDANGYYSINSNPPAPITAPNYYEWCADHNHPLETNPVGAVGGGGPMTLPDPLILTNGLWFNGTPYLGRDAVVRSRGPTPLPPAGALQNPPEESGIAFMWHSHNEREITTNDVFPGGMLMMMLVDPPSFFIDETL